MLIDKTYTRICKICNNNFETPWPKSKHCSDECNKVSIKIQQRAKYYRRKAREAPTKTLKDKYIQKSKMGTKSFCKYCGDIFDTFGKNIAYCNDICRKNAKKEARGVETHKRCRECGDLFDLKGQGGYKYCPVCRGEVRRLDIPENKKTLKGLIDTHEQEVEINPYFLKRGSKSDGTGNANLMTNY
jgi:hypothetical protein